jgi:hypothetical protein
MSTTDGEFAPPVELQSGKPILKFLCSKDVMFAMLLLVSCICNMLGPLAMDKVFLNSQGYAVSTLRPFYIHLEEILGYVLTGLLTSEYVMIGYWAVSDDRSLAYRSIIVSGIGVLLGVCLVIGCYAWPGMPLFAAICILVSSWLFGYTTWGLINLWDRLFKIRTASSQSRIERKLKKQQFGIGYLLVVMTVIAIGMIAVKATIPKNLNPWLGGIVEYFWLALWFGWLYLGVSVVAWTLKNAVLGWSLGYGCLLTLLILFGPLIFQLVASMILPGQLLAFSSGNDLTAAYIIESGVVGGSVLGAFLMRWYGFRTAPRL